MVSRNPTAVRSVSAAERSAPATNPTYTALVSRPTCPGVSPHAAASSGATAETENQRLIDSSSAVATSASARYFLNCTSPAEGAAELNGPRSSAVGARHSPPPLGPTLIPPGANVRV